MNSNTKNAKIAAITETTLVLGIDVGSEERYARAFDSRGYEFSTKPFKFSNSAQWSISMFISFHIFTVFSMDSFHVLSFQAKSACICSVEYIAQSLLG